MLKQVFLAGGVRTPIGTFAGALSEVPRAGAGAAAVKGALHKVGISLDQIDEVIFGNVIGAGLGQNVARQVSIGAGLAPTVGATTVNKVCGSRLKAVMLAAQAIQCGDASVIVAGGTESMSRAPYLLDQARGGYRMGDGVLIDAMIRDGLWDVYNNVHMGTCGDACARKYEFSRQQQDDFAIASFKRAWRRSKAARSRMRSFRLMSPLEKRPCASRRTRIRRNSTRKSFASFARRSARMERSPLAMPRASTMAPLRSSSSTLSEPRRSA